MSSETYVIVGKLGRPRGVFGDMYVTPETDFPDRFLGLTEIFVRVGQVWEKRRLASAQMISGRPVLRFDDVTTPEEAARLTNRELAVLKSQVVALPADMYYIHDLVGCRVIEADSGDVLGEVVDVERYPANDVYVVRSASGKLLRCPAVRHYVKTVDIAARKISIVAAGLFEG